MSSFLEQTRKFIENEKLFLMNPPLVCGVSGGMDSMVMLHILSKLGYDIILAHVNYGLRNEASDKDQELVEEYANQLNIPVQSKKLSKADIANLKQGNLQEKARIIRHRWFDLLCQQYENSIVCLGHHMNDVSETFLYHAIRGSGLKGLKSIAPIYRNIRRPLWFANKVEIEKYAKENGVPFREDASNLDTEYDRNYIRNKIIPTINQRWPNLDERLLRTIENTRRDFTLLHQLIDVEKRKWVTTESELVRIGPLDQFFSDNKSRSLLYYFLTDFNFTFEQSNSIFLGWTNIGKMYLTNSHQLLVDRNYLIIKALKDTNKEVTLVHKHTRFCNTATHRFAIQKADEVQFDIKNEFEYIDKEKINFPLSIRLWKEGDRITPLGMNGNSKLISDILINRKVTRFEKEETYVLCNQDGRIIWLMPYCLSGQFKVSEQTKRPVQISWKRL